MQAARDDQMLEPDYDAAVLAAAASSDSA